VVTALSPGPIGEDAPVANPIGVAGLRAVLDRVNGVLELVLAAGFLCGVVALVVRWRRSSERERRQLAWILQGVMTAGALLLGAAGLHALGAPESLRGALVALAMAMPALGIAIAVLREQLLDIELVVSRTLVYAGFSGVLLASYALALAISSLWFSAQADIAVSLLATGLVAAVLGGLRERIQRLLDRALFGRRSQPYDVLVGLGAIAEKHADRSALIAELVGEVRSALRLPYVSVVDARGQLLADGHRPAEVVAFPLACAGRRLGALEVGPRSGERGFSADERALLASAAARIAASVWTQQLDADLQGAREKLVRSREQERTRIRRDLHDGVGPVLAAATLQLDSLRRRLPPEDRNGRELADRIKGELQQVVLDIRALLEGLRPPNLDVGLARALEGNVEALVDAGLAVELDVDGLPDLDPAVEVAAYRIASEAITNVVKHASASQCEVRVAVEDGTLVVAVADNGRGMAIDHDRGVGLDSLAERAAELGGSVHCGSDPSGVTVTARLPMEAT
jgi:signal transduction histidine kinase